MTVIRREATLSNIAGLRPFGLYRKPLPRILQIVPTFLSHEDQSMYQCLG